MLFVLHFDMSAIQHFPELLVTGLWIRIDLIQIRIQYFSSIRIRIHNVFKSRSNADPDPQQTFRIKLEKCTEKYSFYFIFLPLTADPAPQSH
jgi:hypothetical protein